MTLTQPSGRVGSAAVRHRMIDLRRLACLCPRAAAVDDPARFHGDVAAGELHWYDAEARGEQVGRIDTGSRGALT